MIAFQEGAAVVDGNVARVLARLFGISDDILSTRAKRRIAALAAQLIPRKRPGDFNQAWMDLGSMVCTPRPPPCAMCPLVGVCVAVATGRTDVLPRRAIGKKGKPLEVASVVGVFVHGRKMLLRRRLGGCGPRFGSSRASSGSSERHGGREPIAALLEEHRHDDVRLGVFPFEHADHRVGELEGDVGVTVEPLVDLVVHEVDGALADSAVEGPTT